ncbi:hypothetical protein ACWKSP_41050 [Micromonosporaceae bacterium Da 78-11]
MLTLLISAALRAITGIARVAISSLSIAAAREQNPSLRLLGSTCSG